MISFSTDAAEQLQELLNRWGHAKYVARIRFENGSEEDVELQPPPDSGFPMNGQCLVKKFDNETDQGTGEPYRIDLFSGPHGGKHVIDLCIY